MKVTARGLLNFLYFPREKRLRTPSGSRDVFDISRTKRQDTLAGPVKNKVSNGASSKKKPIKPLLWTRCDNKKPS